MSTTLRGTRVTPPPHPSQGGRPYDDSMRQQVLSLHLSGFDLSDNVSNPNAEWLIPQRHNKTFPCARTCKNWIKLYETEGHVNPKVHTGNKESTREINGEDLVNLALYRLVRPEAYLSEVKAYIHNRNPGNLPYSDSQIVRAEQRIGNITRGVGT